MERNETLERNASQDQERIKELQQQIEQLKNIESIIKKRER
jgi:chaperonin cofactor prefoldin